MAPRTAPHGGNLRALAAQAGCGPEDILDFSANINPLGPPPWLRSVVAGALSSAVHYPDPEAVELRRAAAACYGGAPEEFLAGNGTSDILYALPRLAGPRGAPFARALIPGPAYVDYARAASLAGLRPDHLPLVPEDGFALPFDRLDAELAAAPAMVFLGRPNNPTGRGFAADDLRGLAGRRPDSLFVVDEAFADFPGEPDRLAGRRPENVVVLLSLTKFLAVPGLRLGLCAASPETIRRIAALLPPWQCSTLAQAVGARGLADDAFRARSVAACREYREHLRGLLAAFPEIAVFPGEADFLLCRLLAGGPKGAGPVADAPGLAERLLAERIAVRVCDNFAGLDASWFRLAVRPPEENARLAEALARVLGRAPARKNRRTPAIMVQGVCSNAGKSVLAAGLCRVLLQDGHAPCPFKAQNMSLNSFVTQDGGEMGRAQVTQALASGREPDARMNPVLLKPSSDTGSQVIVLGRPVGNMRVAEYTDYKPRVFGTVCAAYDELAAGAGVMVLEGAGSPAEVNLKAHDIVNMAMARHAGARVLLAADIDRGGSFASLAGTMDCLQEWERALVAGFVLNKFRGDPSLLAEGFDFLRLHTGRPTLGVVPWLPDLGLPEEDSVSFKAGISLPRAKKDAVLDVAVADLPHISNFTDLDALAAEPDVAVRLVRSGDELGEPDMVVLPGSKNTLSDLAWLRASGIADALAALDGRAEIVGICGGLQMLGRRMEDPLGLESAIESAPGLGLLDLSTVLAADKTLTRRTATDLATGRAVTGYEIHHGLTDSEGEGRPLYAEDEGLGRAAGHGRTWGTYLHGVFDADEYRRAVLDRLRGRRGLPPLGRVQVRYGIDAALDRLAEVVRTSLDMGAVYRMLGF
ncbi:Cobyric acid synthase [Desulfovibrio sp. X2]|uniref:cobyric acid synthase n=1 Tax=Desulfovibrio sp. X2 TaxID=941449 RepID=UPI000358AF94|nr:cobyric acid synthase [Desulfovibrio sp. X2]EPR44708.1 Cobyric acid synthase [Desulfovibrio sp. X2]